MNFNELAGKMYLVIFLKVTKKQGFTFPLKIHFWRNHMGGGGALEQASDLKSFIIVLPLYFNK